MMNHRLIVGLALVVGLFTGLTLEAKEKATEKLITMVRNVTRVKILESNNVTLRPGSIYENTTVFESLLELRQPAFNYEFIDSGLGAAEPLYPLYQKGHQGSWGQVIPAFFSQHQRHIDHYTTVETPEHCRVDGLYGLRHIDEYPPTVFAKERAEGYQQIVVRLEYYTRLRPDAQCGRHFSHDFNPAYDPMVYLKAHHDGMTMADFPRPEADGFEWKISAIRHLSEELSRNKWPRFDLARLAHNSLWYYEEMPGSDYGINTTRPQPGLRTLSRASQLLVPADEPLRREFPLRAFLSENDQNSLFAFLDGQPTVGFDPSTEPGADTFRLSDVTPHNVYTSGLELEPIHDVVTDVKNPANFALVSMVVRPYEDDENVSPEHARVIPQVRFVFQQMDPRETFKPREQLYFHVKFDVVDRGADEATRNAQHLAFLRKYDELVTAHERKDPRATEMTLAFVHDVLSRPAHALSWSSALTGIWVFGQMHREPNGLLTAQRIVRNGIDVGYYSSVYDNDLFRAAAKATRDPGRRADLEAQLTLQTPTTYRDPRRHDSTALTFNRVTCAQCHQMAGRDGVHVAFNDGIDRRWTAPVRPTEYVVRESDRQLALAKAFWAKRGAGDATGE